MEKLYVIKIGGNIIDDEHKLSSFLKDFAAIKEKKILVHGGGKLATKVAEAMGIQQQMVDGRRITDAETLKVVTMVYAGYINKNIVAMLQAESCNAIGLCGADANVIKAHKRTGASIDYGFVGDVDKVNSEFIKTILQTNTSIVFAPITHNSKGQLLNTNADTVANEIAKAMQTFYDVALIYCFEKDGVLMNASDDASVIKEVTSMSFASLKNDHIISAGMIPKLDNAFAALNAGVQQVIIGNAEKLAALINHQSGTAIIYGA
ncbi:MAG: acetylglutamate kinase [Ferruginibacter sp.]